MTSKSSPAWRKPEVGAIMQEHFPVTLPSEIAGMLEPLLGFRPTLQAIAAKVRGMGLRQTPDLKRRIRFANNTEWAGRIDEPEPLPEPAWPDDIHFDDPRAARPEPRVRMPRIHASIASRKSTAALCAEVA